MHLLTRINSLPQGEDFTPRKAGQWLYSTILRLSLAREIGICFKGRNTQNLIVDSRLDKRTTHNTRFSLKLYFCSVSLFCVRTSLFFAYKLFFACVYRFCTSIHAVRSLPTGTPSWRDLGETLRVVPLVFPPQFHRCFRSTHLSRIEPRNVADGAESQTYANMVQMFGQPIEPMSK